MAWVYMLRGSAGRYYIGSTTDLQWRLEQHRRGHTHSTRRLGQTLEMAASVQVANLADARKLEREMKRKKNPRLALFLLQQRRSESSG
jgi:predicted GIY-YIG superfamily endonuclease